MKRASITDAAPQSLAIDIGPLLDVVFILLIFFIVSAVFVRETGIEVDRPSAISQNRLSESGVLLALSADGEVWHGGLRIGLAGVGPLLKQQRQLGRTSVIIQADKLSGANELVQVVDACKLAGFGQVSIATRQGGH